MIAADIVARIVQCIAYPPAAVERVLEVDFVDRPHPLEIPFRNRHRLVILARTRQLKNPALLRQR
jgi:hypothetical protein